MAANDITPKYAYAPASTGAYARAVDTISRYADYIGMVRAKRQLSSIAGNSLAADYVRSAAQEVLNCLLNAERETGKKPPSIREIFARHGIAPEPVPDHAFRQLVSHYSHLGPTE